jgi:hypothetical protein
MNRLGSQQSGTRGSLTDRWHMSLAFPGRSSDSTRCMRRVSQLSSWTASAKSTPEDRLVPEEGVLRASLPMVARCLLPLSSSDFRHYPNRSIASRPRARSPPQRRGGLDRRHHDPRTTCGGDGVEGDRVVGRVRCETGHCTSDPLDQRDAGEGVIHRRVGQGVADDVA